MFSISIEKEVIEIDEDGNENVAAISYKVKFIDSARFTSTSLSNLADHLTEEIHKINCKDFDCFLEYENKINHLEKNKIDVDSIREDQKEFIKNNKLTRKTQQRFRSEKLHVFTEEIIKIALSSNDDKRIQSIDSIETYGNGKSKDLICKEDEIKCNSIIKQYKNV